MKKFLLRLFGKIKTCPITHEEMHIKDMKVRCFQIGSGVNLTFSRTYYSPEGFKIRQEQDKKYDW